MELFFNTPLPHPGHDHLPPKLPPGYDPPPPRLWHPPPRPCPPTTHTDVHKRCTNIWHLDSLSQYAQILQGGMVLTRSWRTDTLSILVTGATKKTWWEFWILGQLNWFHSCTGFVLKEIHPANSTQAKHTSFFPFRPEQVIERSYKWTRSGWCAGVWRWTSKWAHRALPVRKRQSTPSTLSSIKSRRRSRPASETCNSYWLASWTHATRSRQILGQSITSSSPSYLRVLLKIKRRSGKNFTSGAMRSTPRKTFLSERTLSSSAFSQKNLRTRLNDKFVQEFCFAWASNSGTHEKQLVPFVIDAPNKHLVCHFHFKSRKKANGLFWAENKFVMDEHKIFHFPDLFTWNQVATLSPHSHHFRKSVKYVHIENKRA